MKRDVICCLSSSFGEGSGSHWQPDCMEPTAQHHQTEEWTSKINEKDDELLTLEAARLPDVNSDLAADAFPVDEKFDGEIECQFKAARLPDVNSDLAADAFPVDEKLDGEIECQFKVEDQDAWDPVDTQCVPAATDDVQVVWGRHGETTIGAVCDSPKQSWPSSGTSRMPSSNQSLWRKIQFACVIISPMACGTTAFFGKDIYILKLGADVKSMSITGSVVLFWAAACQPLVGHCMDKGFLTRLFPHDRWGRRAPWFVTHTFGTAVATGALFSPPNFDPLVLCLWFGIWSMLNVWFLGVLFNCLESTRTELFPTKEERSEIESIVKLAVGLGNGLGYIPQLVLATNAGRQELTAASVFYFLVAFLSLVAVPVLRQARQVVTVTAAKACIPEFIEVLRAPSMMHLLAYRAVEGFAIAILLSSSIYYVTFVEGLNGQGRANLIIGVATCIAMTALLLLPFWLQFFRKRRRSVNVNVISGRVLALGFLAPLVLILGNIFFPRPGGFLLYTVSIQVSLTGMTFWRANVLSWIIDEDCQASFGRRREASFVGVALLIAALSRAAGLVVVQNGLAILGMQLVNCEAICIDQGAVDQSGCVDACEVQSVEAQPEALRTYLQALYLFVVPVLNVLMVVLACTMPLHGERLDRIYAAQKELYDDRNAPSSASRPEVEA